MISIIIPIYNSKDSLKQCLESIFAQTYQDFELLLVNDGSTDDSESICIEYSSKYNEKIQYLKKANGGVSSARNLGIENAHGEYICFVDSDDYIDNTYLEVLYYQMQKHNVDFTMCDIYSDNKVSNSVKGFSNNDEIINAIMSKEGMKNRGPVCKLFKRKIIGNLRFDENIYLGEDTLFCIEYAKQCKNGIHINKALYHYDIPTSSIKYRNDPRQLTKYLTYIDSRVKMLNDVSMLSRKPFVLIVNSLFESIQESYFIAKRHKKYDVQIWLCQLMKEKLNVYDLSFMEKERPLSWWIMAFFPKRFDSWMYLYGKYHGLLFKLGLQR